MAISPQPYGPYAIDEGLVEVVEPITRVRIHQKNTDKLIIAEVPVKNGRFDDEGDYQIAGGIPLPSGPGLRLITTSPLS